MKQGKNSSTAAGENPMTPEEFRRFFNIFNPTRPLDISNPEDRKYYIDFSGVRGGEIIEELKRTITLADEETCQLFSGHRGSGKSTELLRLKAELEKQGFHVVYFESDKSLDMTDIDISDILLVIARHISESLKPSISLRPGYFQNLFNDIQELLQIPLDPKSIDLSVGIAKITMQARESPKLRNQLRETLEPQTKIILDSINKDILEKAIAKLKQRNCRGIVTIIDNLEKVVPRLLPSGRNQLEYLFAERGAQLRGLRCHLVYTIPLELIFSPQHEVMVEQLGGGISPKVLPMVPTHFRDGKNHEEGLTLLKQMVMARAFPNTQFDKRLDLTYVQQIFDQPETLDRLCHISGGRVRNLISLLYRCLQIQDLPVTHSLLERAIIERRNQYRQVISNSQWQILQRIAQEKPTGIANSDHQTLFRHSYLFEYRDRNERWFDINPILAEAPEMENSYHEPTDT
jgi:hypothetical protein